LELHGSRCKNASSSVGIGEAAVAETVASSGIVGADAVLSIVKLSKHTRWASRCLKLDALWDLSGDEGVSTEAKSDLSKNVFHYDEMVVLDREGE
jgi:hypothetical protein